MSCPVVPTLLSGLDFFRSAVKSIGTGCTFSHIVCLDLLDVLLKYPWSHSLAMAIISSWFVRAQIPSSSFNYCRFHCICCAPERISCFDLGLIPTWSWLETSTHTGCSSIFNSSTCCSLIRIGSVLHKCLQLLFRIHTFWFNPSVVYLSQLTNHPWLFVTSHRRTKACLIGRQTSRVSICARILINAF